MSSHYYTSFSSSSFSTATSSNGQRSGQAYRQTAHSTPSGTTTQTASQNLGGPVIYETKQFDAHGRQILEDGRTIGQGSGNAGGGTRRIEDVTDEQEGGIDRDREYLRRMDEVYVKKEGGA